MNPAAEPIAYCTIASANYLARVQVLLQSIERHHSGARHFVLLCEAPETCRRISAETGYEFWSPADVCDGWRDMSFYYNIIELNTALKPFFLEKILDRGFGTVVYFDPDIEIYDSLAPLAERVCRHDVTLTPHVCEPIPADGHKPAMEDYIRGGQFNLGFVAMTASSGARALLRWWQEVCRERCIFDRDNGFFVDQFWAAAFPSFTDRCGIVRDPGYNVAYWNLFQREVTQDGSGWRANGVPLVFFHFSGLAPDLTRVSRHQDRVRAASGSALHRLLTAYRARLGEMPWSRYDKIPYSFAAYASGEPIAQIDRRKYLYLDAADRVRLGDPFASRDVMGRVVCVPLSRGPRAFLARVWLERLWRQLWAYWGEFVHKVRVHGPIKAIRLALRRVAALLA